MLCRNGCNPDGDFGISGELRSGFIRERLANNSSPAVIGRYGLQPDTVTGFRSSAGEGDQRGCARGAQCWLSPRIEVTIAVDRLSTSRLDRRTFQELWRIAGLCASG